MKVLTLVLELLLSVVIEAGTKISNIVGGETAHIAAIAVVGFVIDMVRNITMGWQGAPLGQGTFSEVNLAFGYSMELLACGLRKG